MKLTDTQKKQAKTSRPQIAAGLSEWETGPVNLDIGGGKYDFGTDYLAEHGIHNMVYDPYNRSADHNANVINQALNLKVDSITCLNVLNVIRNRAERITLLALIAEIATAQENLHGKAPAVIFQIFKEGKSDVQVKKPAEFYLKEIQKVFPEWEAQLVNQEYIVV